ncbi:MAG: TerC family protein [Pirellulales bacterium]|nr:TerC family protein [Pirellulales bacterium]
MAELFTVGSLVAFATLAIMEIVLGIDNVVFLAILTGKLPEHQQPKARTTGLALAAAGRIALLFAISWVITLDKSVLFELPFDMPSGGHGSAAPAEHSEDGVAIDRPGMTPITAKDLVLLLGGMFLLAKATWEIGHQMDSDHGTNGGKAAASFGAALAQIVAIDMVFSLDSVLTAVGMVRPEDYSARWIPLSIMIAAVLASIAVMLAFSGPISQFVNNHPSVKMLALAFLILIGMVLVAEALHTHVPRGYVYFAMGFSLLVETLNLRAAAARARQATHGTPA